MFQRQTRSSAPLRLDPFLVKPECPWPEASPSVDGRRRSLVLWPLLYTHYGCASIDNRPEAVSPLPRIGVNDTVEITLACERLVWLASAGQKDASQPEDADLHSVLDALDAVAAFETTSPNSGD